MCGIAGIINRSGDAISLRPPLKRMTDVMKHRGPDDEGFVFFSDQEILAAGGKDTPEEVWHSRLNYAPSSSIEEADEAYPVGLGHRRLSIIDLTPTGHQPMCSEDGQLWVVYNGEIYNYLELREELQCLGHHFRTRTDTEVLISAYRQWGEDCLGRLNGMWAFVLYDRRKKVLFGARDRFGVKPLYYYMDSNIFAFASEIKALVHSSLIKKETNPQAVFDYLVLGRLENEEEGLFKNILELLPATAFHYDLTGHTLKKWRYYTLSYQDRWEGFREPDLEGYRVTIRDLLVNAVTLRLRADVPIGSCLSGGLDSSAIVCIVNQLLQKGHIAQIGERQKVFTACYQDDDSDESEWARIVADHTRTSWHRTFPSSTELLEDLEDIVYVQDIPFGSTSMFAQYRVMKLARENGVKVVLDGQGGDELFGGYRGYYRVLFAEMLRSGAARELWTELKHLDQSCINGKFLLSSSLKLWGGKLLPVFMIEAMLRAMRREIAYFSPDFLKEHRNRLEGLRDKSATLFNRALYESLTGFEFRNLLRYEDRNSMRFSIEARIPFADDIHLIESLFQIPSAYKIRLGRSKYLMRESLKGVLPEPIRLRSDKVGFATPEAAWLNEIKDPLRAYLPDGPDGYIHVPSLRKGWASLFLLRSGGGADNLWRLINFLVWRKVYRL